MNLYNPYRETTVLERLTMLMKEYHLSRRKFAEMINVPPTTINSLFQRGSIPSSSLIESIIKAFPSISSDWLISGKGVMSKNNLLYNTEPIYEFETHTDKLENATLKAETRPRIPYTAAAGSLTSAVEGITSDQCEHIPRINIFPEYDFTIIIKGDSMEPKYEGGDEVACKRIDSTSFIQWGKVHVLDTAQGILIKRTYEDGDRIRCVSYNQEYPDFSINKSEIYSMSLVVGLVRL